jgi:Tfp pilus assembly protein PilN
MTVDIPTRAPEQAPGGDHRNRRSIMPESRGGRSRTVGKAPLVVGGQPRANLLPPEIILKRKQLKTRRALRAGVLLVAVATAAACVGTFGVASVSQVQFAAAQETQTRLVAEQGAYGEVRDVQNTIETITAGQLVGSSTEIAWEAYLTQLQATLPSGVVLKNVAIESGTPMAAFGQSDGPLQGARVASLTFTATSETLPTFPEWLRSMADLPGFVDATPGSVKQENGIYIAEVLLHINSEAFSMRFDPAHIAAVEAEKAAQAAHANAQPKSLVAVVPVEEAPASDGSDAVEGED